MEWIAISALGLTAGILAGLFGLGGAILIVPGLVLLLGLPKHTAHGTSLAALLLPVGIPGAYEYYKRGQVNIPYAAILAAGLFLGAYLGANLSGLLSGLVLQRAFGVLLLALAIKELFF
jgi:hypothetical protein